MSNPSDVSEQALGNVQSIDFSLWGLFSHADFVVQSVIVILILSSIWCWAIVINKSRLMRQYRSDADEFEQAFWNASSLDDLQTRIRSNVKDPMTAVFMSAMREWNLTTKDSGQGSMSTLPQRIETMMNVSIDRELLEIEKQLPVLPTVGSIAPFVGLFGTVWGIVHSFQGIALMKSTNLAVVAPGIAEALLATALGLVAAIPAIVAYNKISVDINNYAARLGSFSQEFMVLITRKIDKKD